jgi:hypothetical protein
MGDSENKEFDSPAVIVGQKRGNPDNGGPASKRANVSDPEGLFMHVCHLNMLIFSSSKGVDPLGCCWRSDWKR